MQKEKSIVEIAKYNLNKNYLSQIVNFYDGDRTAAMRFMTGYFDYVRRNEKLAECSPMSLINSAMMIASFRFIPSSVSGEAYLIPRKRDGVLEASFQVGYQGWVVLFYRAGVRAIQGEIVREKDEFELVNGVPVHKVDYKLGKKSRGAAVGCYVKVILPSGEPIYNYMNGEDIIDHAKRFSQSFEKDDSPWRERNDPNLHMWKKTALLQMKAFMPKNSEIARALEEDYKDSKISESFLESKKKMSMGNFLNQENENGQEKNETGNQGDVQIVPVAESPETDEYETVE